MDSLAARTDRAPGTESVSELAVQEDLTFSLEQRKVALAALGAMKLANLKLYGGWPDGGKALRIMAEVYLGAIVRAGGERLFEHIGEASERVIDAARGKERDFPTAGEFADICVAIRTERFTLICRDMVAPDGSLASAWAEVRRDAALEERERALDRDALRRGLTPKPKPEAATQEAIERMRKMLGWESPRG